jgi:elongation factor Ts
MIGAWCCAAVFVVLTPFMFLCSYVHNAVAPGQGQTAALVALETAAAPAADAAESMMEGARKLAMHVVASNPTYLNTEEVPEEVIAKEREILLDQVRDSGKPENVLAKIVDGRLSKFYRENALVEQDHMVQEGNPKVMDAMQELGKSAGVGSISVPAFFRAAVGETASQEE